MVDLRLSEGSRLRENDVELVAKISAAHHVVEAARRMVNLNVADSRGAAIDIAGDVRQRFTFGEPDTIWDVIPNDFGNELPFLCDEHHALPGLTITRSRGGRTMVLSTDGRTMTRSMGGRIMVVSLLILLR
jgi:hypothetical protein